MLHVYVKLKEFSDGEDLGSLQIKVNGEVYVEPIYPSAYFQPVSISVQLKEGINEIVLSSETGGSTLVIDRVETQPVFAR